MKELFNPLFCYELYPFYNSLGFGPAGSVLYKLLGSSLGAGFLKILFTAA